MRSLPLWKLNTPDSAQITTVTSASIAVIAVTVRAPALAHAPDAVAACGFGLTHIFSSGSTGWIEISMKQVYNSIDAAF